MDTLRSYRLLLIWQTLRLKSFLPLAIVVQAMFALGIVAGYPLLFPQIDEMTLLFLATGAPAISLITMGLVAVPQVVAKGKLEGTLEYMRSLPVRRLTYLAADLSVWVIIVLPGVVFAVAFGAWALDLSLSISLAVIPAILLVATTSAAIGYAMASVLPPMLAMLLTQVLVVGVLIFSPINFPSERLPEWMQALHAVLPVQAMGEVIRGSLAADTFPLTGGPFLMLTLWCALSLALSYQALRRRA